MDYFNDLPQFSMSHKLGFPRPLEKLPKSVPLPEFLHLLTSLRMNVHRQQRFGAQRLTVVALCLLFHLEEVREAVLPRSEQNPLPVFGNSLIDQHLRIPRCISPIREQIVKAHGAMNLLEYLRLLLLKLRHISPRIKAHPLNSQILRIDQRALEIALKIVQARDQLLQPLVEKGNAPPAKQFGYVFRHVKDDENVPLRRRCSVQIILFRSFATSLL
jgi:hypothetical protein